MSRYMPAKVRRFVRYDPGIGAKVGAWRVVCPDHKVVAEHSTHNGAHMAKARHNRLPHHQKAEAV